MQVSTRTPKIEAPQSQQSAKHQPVPPRKGAGSFAAALEGAQADASRPAPSQQQGMPPASMGPNSGRVL